MKVDFSVGLGRNEAIYEIGDHAKVAEENGFSHVTFVDQPNLSRDVYTMMTVAALNTQRIKIGQGVTDPATFHPSVTANATATVNELSGGRAFLGLGSGGPFGKEMRPRPLSEVRETIQFIKSYTSGKEAQFNGARMHSEWVRRPFPIYLACNGPKACEVAGEMADGAILGGLMLPEVVKWKVSLIRRAADRAGRDPSKIDIWARTLTFVADSKEDAQREVAGYAITKAHGAYQVIKKGAVEAKYMKEALERRKPGLVEEFKRIYEGFDPYQHEMVDAPQNTLATQTVIDCFLLTGRPEDICQQITELTEAGVNNISSVMFTVIDKKGMMREIGDKVMPCFRN